MEVARRINGVDVVVIRPKRYPTERPYGGGLKFDECAGGIAPVEAYIGRSGIRAPACVLRIVAEHGPGKWAGLGEARVKRCQDEGGSRAQCSSHGLSFHFV